jgi:hypothetical protein
MRMSRITLTAPENTDEACFRAAVAIDLIWAVTVPRDRVEHIAALAAPGRVEIGVFTTLPDSAAALAAARCLAIRACARSALLHGWSWTTPGDD